MATTKTPVLVVHGIANHEQAPFQQQVSALARVLGDQYELCPVFWGDLGGRDFGLTDVVPGAEQIKDAASQLTKTIGSEAAPLILSEEEIDRIAVAAGVAASRRANKSGDLVPKLPGSPDVAEDTDGENDAFPVADIVKDAVREAVRDELPFTDTLRQVTDPDILEAVGRLLGDTLSVEATLAAGSEEDAELRAKSLAIPSPTDALKSVGESLNAVRQQLVNRAREIVRQVDDLLGRAVGGALGNLNTRIRTTIAPLAARTLGDIIAYQGDRAGVRKRLWKVIEENPITTGWGTKDRPISVIAHSLGGVAVFDAALFGTADAGDTGGKKAEKPETGQDGNGSNPSEGPLYIDGLVTFGSQAAFFHVIDPRTEIATYAPGEPVYLPGTIRRWTNLWEPSDPLAFLAGTVFRLSITGAPPLDLKVDSPLSALAGESFWSHSLYWSTPELANAAKDTFSLANVKA